MPSKEEQLRSYLELSDLMVVATSRNDKPYVATVYFCYDDECNLYFLSTEDRRHSEEIEQNENVAVAISDQGVEWPSEEKKGLQIEGECRKLTGEKARGKYELYLERFPEAEMLENEFSEDPPEDAHKIWKVEPEKVKIWDEERYGYEGKVLKF